MTVAPPRRKAIPRFRDALARVSLVPSILFLLASAAAAVIIVWSSGSSFEARARAGADTVALSIQHLWSDRSDHLRLLAAYPGDKLAIGLLPAALREDFTQVHWLAGDGQWLAAWPLGTIPGQIPETYIQAAAHLPLADQAEWLEPDTGGGTSPLALAAVTADGSQRVIATISLSQLTDLSISTAQRLGLSAVILDSRGRYVAGERASEYLKASTLAPGQVLRVSVGGQTMQVVSQRLPVRKWTLLIAQPLDDINAPVLVVFWVLIPLVLGVVVVGLFLLRRLNRQLFTALESLSLETKRITLGDYSEVLARTSYQDLNDILQDFESMRESVWLRQQDLKDSEYRFRRMFEDAAIGILHTTYDGVPIDLNQALARMLGYTTPEEAMAAITDVGEQLYVRPEERRAILQMLSGAPQGRIQITTEFYARDRRVLVVNNHLGRVYDSHRGEFILEAFIEDVTEIKKAEIAVLELNAELEGKVVERTKHLQQALEDLGQAQDQLVRSEKMAALGQLIAGIAHEINTPLGAIVASNDNIGILLKRVLESLPWLLQLLNTDQRSLFYRMYEVAYRGVDVIPSSQLRTKRRSATALLVPLALEHEEELVDYLAELNLTDRLDEFLPLVSDTLGRDAVKMVYEMVSLEKSCLVIDQASDKAAKVIGALRNFAHEEQGHDFQKVNLKTNWENVLTLFQSRLRHGVELKLQLDQAPEIWGYGDRLAQVWTNLVSNALQAMDFKGVLEIRVVPENDAVVVTVTDNGPGIPEHIRSRIFEPFFTTKKAGEGSGLGLDICRKIVEEHQGQLTVESQPGRTVFSVRLPVVQGPPQLQQSRA